MLDLANDTPLTLPLRSVYSLTYTTYIIAWLHFMSEWLVYRTINLSFGSFSPMVVSSESGPMLAAAARIAILHLLMLLLTRSASFRSHLAHLDVPTMEQLRPVDFTRAQCNNGSQWCLTFAKSGSQRAMQPLHILHYHLSTGVHLYNNMRHCPGSTTTPLHRLLPSHQASASAPPAAPVLPESLSQNASSALPPLTNMP